MTSDVQISPFGLVGLEEAVQTASEQQNVKTVKTSTGWIVGGTAGGGPKAKKPSVRAPLSKSRIQLLKVGADIEEFLRDKGGNPVPVVGLIGGTKNNPLPVLSEGFALQEDNVALEYNIPPAADSHKFIYNLMRIQEEITARCKAMNLVPAIEASMRFKESQLLSDQARIFGCEPDFNVWEQAPNEKPTAIAENLTLRTAGGHVHVSFLIEGKRPEFPRNIADLEAIVMAMDIFLGVPFSLMDTDKERMKLYGKAGAFRPKVEEYGGVEYRVLSNFWTRSPTLMEYVFENTKRAVDWVGARETPKETLYTYRPYVYRAINDGSKDHATALLEKFNIPLPAVA